jgi:replicative DNA helicase
VTAIQTERDPYADRHPPYSEDAEQAVLAAMMMDTDAVMRAAEVLDDTMFYREGHRRIFRAMIAITERGAVIDPLTLADELDRRGELAASGGKDYIGYLVDAVPTSANVEYHARIVREKSLLRRLIEVSTGIVGEAFEARSSAAELLDAAEHRILALSQQRGATEFARLKELMWPAMERIEALQKGGKTITGVPSGFADLDELTSGFQPSDLVILAARPSMGKCLAADAELVLEDGSIATIEEIYRAREGRLLSLDGSLKLCQRTPSDFIDDAVKPVFRVTTRLGRQVTTTLTHPFLTVGGWTPLACLRVGDRIAVPRTMPVFGSTPMRDCELEQIASRLENAADSSEEIPACVFRLPRVQLARFLRRMLGLEPHLSINAADRGSLEHRTASERRARQLQHLLLRFGVLTRIGAEPNRDGTTRWCVDPVEAGDLRGALTTELPIDASVALFASAVTDVSPHARSASNGDVATDAGPWDGHASRWASAEWRATDIDVVDAPNLAESDVYWDEIVSIDSLGERQVYDLTIPGTHNFIADDVCVHNTALCLNIAQHAAIDHRVPVAFFSLEMSKESLVQRLLTSEAMVDAQRLRKGMLRDEDYGRLARAAGFLNTAPIFIDDSAGITLLEMRSKARRLKVDVGLGLIIVDYLQLINGPNAENRQQEISQISRSLKALAKELQVPVLALSQLSRAPEQRSGESKRPQLSDLRESGAIEQDADLVMFIFRPEVYEGPTDKDGNSLEGKAEVIIGKQRNGPIGTVNLTFHKQFTRFESATNRVP